MSIQWPSQDGELHEPEMIRMRELLEWMDNQEAIRREIASPARWFPRADAPMGQVHPGIRASSHREYCDATHAQRKQPVNDPFEDEDHYTGLAMDAAMIDRAQDALRVRLPQSYLDLLALRNGGLLRHRRCPTTFRTSWASDHFEVHELYGIGGDNGIDAPLGSAYLIAAWDYPDIGVVVFGTPSGGHDTVKLDYSACGPSGESSVAYLDEDRVPRTVAATFGAFVDLLQPTEHTD